MVEQKFDKDTWQTPKYVFNWLEQRFAWFHYDGCANKSNSLCEHWIGDGGVAPDFLSDDLIEKISDSWQIEQFRIFVNPPYSDVSPFLVRAAELRAAGHLVVMLLNNDKSTQWYQQLIHNVANEVIEIVGGRIAFIHPVTQQEIKGNSKGQMVVVFDPTIEGFVQRSVALEFIKERGGYRG